MESTAGFPPPCQEKILQICKNLLNPQGIAYVSYNTYPGWHMRGMIRDMLFFHARQYSVPAMKVRQARNLLDFLGKATAKDNTAYAHLLRAELESFRRSSDSYLYHEHLEEFNDPLYFYEFAERAQKAGLKYLGEADMRVMVPGNFPPEIENVLQMLAQDMIHLEQYMDFLRNRMFRQTLLVHQNVTPNYALRWEQVRGFWVASPAKPKSSPLAPRGDDAAPGASMHSASAVPSRSEGTTLAAVFETPDGVTLQSTEPIVKAAMVVLSAIWPRSLRFEELLEQARKRLTAEGAENAEKGKEEQALGQAILTFYAQASTSLVELWARPPRFTTVVSDKPRASALARAMATTKSRVTNLRHESVFLGDFERQLLQRLDGAHDRAALVKELAELVRQGELNVEKDGQPVRADGEMQTILDEAVSKQLQVMAKSALLEG